MFTDEDGNERPILQMTYDALILERSALLEKLAEFEEQDPGTESLKNIIVAIIQSQQKQMDHLMRAIGTLEARSMALQQAAGVEEIYFKGVDIHHERLEDGQ